MFNKNKNKISLVEMEIKLAQDKSGEFRRSIMNNLNEFEGEISKKIAQGLDKEDFNVYNKLKVAIISAKKVINKF